MRRLMRLRRTDPPTFAPHTTPRRVGEPAGRRSQLATRQPRARRPPFARTRKKSRPSLIRILRPKPRRCDGRFMESNWGEPLAARTTAAGDGGRATDGLVTRTEAVLTLAADFGRLVLAFHNSGKSVPPAACPKAVLLWKTATSGGGRIATKPLVSRKADTVGMENIQRSTFNFQRPRSRNSPAAPVSGIRC